MKEQNFQVSALSLQGIRPTNRYAQKRELFIRIWDTASNSLILGVVKGSGPKGAQVATFLKREIGLALGVLGFFFPETMKKLTGGLIDIQKFQQKRKRLSLTTEIITTQVGHGL